MTRLAPTATEARRFLKAMDPEATFLRGTPEAEAAEGLALSLLSVAWEMYEASAKYVVVGQLRRNALGRVDPAAPEWEQVAFGPFRKGRQGPEAAARVAIEQMGYSAATQESLRACVLEFESGTPASWFRERKKSRDAALARANDDVTIDALEGGGYIEHWMPTTGSSAGEPYYERIRCLHQVTSSGVSTRCVKAQGHAGECQTSWPPLPRCPIEVLDEVTLEFVQCNRPKGHHGDHDPHSKSLFHVDGVDIRGESDE